MPTELIDITGIPKPKLLVALHRAARSHGTSIAAAEALMVGDIDEAEAAELIESGGTYIDYLGGKAIKIEIGGDSIDPRLFDRDHGQGAASLAIDSIR